MSDFFIQNQEEETQQNAGNFGNFNSNIESFKQNKREHYQNIEEYGVELPDGYYDAFRPILENCRTQEERQEMAYKLGTAAKYSELTGEPFADVWQNVDAYSKANFPNLQNQKGIFEATRDMIAVGQNNVKLGNLGQQLMKAHRENDEELAASLMAEIDAINQRNSVLQEHIPDRWWKEAVEAGAPSIPFTGYVAGAGIIGNFLTPAVGTLAATTTSSYLAGGQEYIDMIANGSTPETARIVSNVSGIFQGIIEADLGITSGLLKSTAKLMGKEAAENAAKKTLEEIGRKAFKRFHFGPGKTLVTNFALNYAGNVLGEGVEEASQNVVSVLGKELAAILDGYDLPDDDIKSIVSQTMQEFKGGMLGAVFLGVAPAGLNAMADVRQYSKVKQSAETIESPEAFYNTVKDNPIFEGMSDTNKRETSREIWEKAQLRKEEAVNEEARKIAEIRDAGEGKGQPAVDENGNEIETEANPVARNESGRLFTQVKENKDDNGNVTGGTFLVGDRTQSDNEDNRYGYIKYSQNENGDISIDNFYMKEEREGLRNEVFAEFAREHPDVNIEWNTKEAEATSLKEELIKNNPSGEKNGLNYYTTEELENIDTRKKIDTILREKFHNVRAWFDEEGKEHFERTELTTQQLASGVSLFELIAQKLGKSVTELYNNEFVDGIVGNIEDFKKEITQYNQKHNITEQKSIDDVTGGFNWKETERGVKAVIYTSENADFSTWVHELAHFYQSMLTGELKSEAEKAFNVVKGDWQKSTYTFKNGPTMSSAEAFAYAFQDYLTTGRAENENMKNVLQKFAQFLAQAYNRLRKHLNFTPEIKSVFDKLLESDDSILSKALKAAQEEEGEYKANLKRKAEEKQAQQKAETEKAKQQEAEQREAAAEYTDFENTQEEQSTEEIESKLDEVTNETEKTDNAIDNALENTNLTDEQKAEISEVLNDASTTVVEKAEAVTEAASSVYDDESEIDGYPELMFQLAGEPSIRRMAESEERERILTELDAAQLLDEKYKNMDANSRAARIRRATGWEKDASGQWKYELDDSVNRIKTEFFKANPGILSGTPYLLNLGDILEADELYRVFPYMQNVRVSFYSDPNAFRAVLTPQGIKVNTRYLQGMNGETGLKGVLAHEIQHIIQAMEFADSKGLQGADIEQLYNDVMKAMQAAGERKYNYDLTSLQQGLDAYMQDAGEIEARNVARRIFMNADQRRMNTLASTEDVKRPEILFQKKFKETGNSEWGTTYEMEEGSPLEAAKFLMLKKDGLVKNVFEGKNKDGKSFKVGLCWGHERFGLQKIIDKHIIEHTDFESLEDALKTIQNVLTNGKEKYKNNKKIQIDNGKYRLILDITGPDELVLTVFDNSKMDYEKERTEEEKKLKREELDFVGQNPITQNGTPLPETVSEKTIAQEIDAVKQKYQNTDKWMKAPNGAETNLNEKQWLQVRTPSFKNWFGDWENDPQNASKVLDENGEPLVVYHGTDADFTVFDASKSRANMDIQGNFFSPWDIDAQGYGPNVRAFYLNIKNPANSSQGYSALNTYKGQNEAGIKARELLKSKGFDGVNNDNEEYITFEPNQIKSATDNNGNFDANNPDILFQIAGEIGAENLDNSEVQEGVSRMQNLAIAKQMDAEGKSDVDIRLATGWEKGSDGKWKYEIDDSKVKVDFYAGMKVWENEHPDFIQLRNRILKGEELSEAENERFQKLYSEFDAEQETRKNGEFFKLEEVLDFPELYKAYPTFKNIDVYIGNGDKKGVQGEYESDLNTISLYKEGYEDSPIDWTIQVKSVLLHEIQHAIQYIEGFAKGGSDEQFEVISVDKLEQEIESLQKIANGEKKSRLYSQGDAHHKIEELQARIEEINENALEGQVEVDGNVYANEFEAYRALAGEVEARNVQTRINFTPEQRIETLLTATEDVAPEDKIILFQTVYHGSPHNFENFSTENIGTGEGAQAFGWGLYFTNQESIARFYADKLANEPKRISLIAKNEYLKSRKKSLKDVENKEKYEARIIKNINHFKKELKQAQKAGDESEIKFYEGLIDDSIKQLDEKERLSLVESFKKDIATAEQEINELKASMKNNRNLYTVDIPDEGYLVWDKNISEETVKAVYDGLAKMGEDIKYAPTFDTETTGEDLYGRLSRFFNSDKKASLFLKELGFIGIEYPAHSLSGYTSQDERNYVIFDDTDSKIINHLLFQTNAELMDEARQFATWQEFMAYCEESNDEGNVFESDEAWYRTFWEQANGIAKEEEKKAEVEERKQEAEADTPEMVDRLFISYIKNNPETVDNFVQQVSDIMEMDLGGDEWAQVDEEGGRERERYAVLQDYISAELRDGNWQTAIAKVQGGHEITDYIRKRLITEMTDSYKARDFRSLYAAVMKEKRFTVDALDTRADELLRKLEKYPKRYYDIVSPTEDVTITTPQRRKEIAQEMQNRDMAARIKAGSLKVDDEVYDYLKSVEKKEKDLKKQEQQLTDKIQGLYQDVGNTGLQMLINTHEKLMEQKARLNNRNADIQRKVDRGLRMTDRYTRQTQDMTQTYHELERKFSDLKDSMVITNEVQQILDAQEQRREIREEVTRITKERYLADETKKIRVNLVKQLFRKVPLDKVDFKQAQLIIAIQKLTLPNMIGGVNRWIGRNSPFLNAVLSRIITDSEYKERIVNYLEHVEKQTDTFRDFVESIRNAKSREDFENWGVAEREYAIKYLPKENWVWELKLKEKARDLQESLHLDITQEKVERQVYDADGHPVEDDEGKPVMETAYQFKIGDEALNKLLQETLGDELFNRLMNSPMVEWSTQEMEELVARVNQIRDEGITMRAAKLEARKREAQRFIQQVADAIKDTGITFNDDDTPEEIEKKLKMINKILGRNKNLKGTEASQESGFIAKLNRILHGYKDANVLRVCRVLDNQSEGVNTYLLYRKEDECYNKKMRSIMNRGEVVHKVMAANKINEGELAKSITIDALGTKFTVDELLFFLAADKDYQLDENGNNDNYAATSRNAVCYGNMMSDTASQEQKEVWAKLDADMKEAIEKDLLTPEQRQLLSDNQLDTRPGTTAYIGECNRRWDIVIKAANDYLSTHPEYNALLEAIQADYADQYERMNEVSISEFNVGVNRVKCYVPLVRRETNGDTNENKVMEDLLAINGVGKSGVNKGMTQSRTSISPLHQRPVQTGLFRTWCDSVERTEHFIAYSPYVRLLNRVYNSRDAQYLRRTIEGRYGKGMLDYIDAYISEVANPNAQNTRSTGAELLHILRGKTAPAYLGWKASAIIKQGLTSPWPYMQFVNPAEYLAACFKCNNPKMWEAIQEKSVFMKNRRMDPINDLVDEMAKNAKNKADKFWSSFTKTGMQGLEWIDWVCVAPGWYACYEKKYNQLQKASEARYNAKMAELEERNKSGSGEVLNPTQMETIARQEMLEDIEVEAVTYADDCTRQCQPSNRLTDLAPMFKDKNEFMRAFLQFQTSLNVIWQNIRYDLPYAVKQKEFGRIVGTVLGYTMAGIFMNSVMDGITSGADDDDKEKQALRNLVFYATTQFTDAVPMLGSDFTNIMDQVITGKRGFMNSGTDMTPTASKLFSAFTSASKGNWEKAAELTAEGIGLYLGAPVSGAKEINKLLGKPLSEGDVNLKKGISDVYGIAGDILEE